MTHRFFGWRAASFLVVLPLALLVYAAALWSDTTAIVFPTPPRSDSIRLAATAARPVFTHSVIPGGAYSPEELRDVFRRDAVVAAHYRDVDPGEMRLTTLSRGKAAYVSYRVGDRVYWTRNRVWIAPGESVLTNGTVEIRARCGNCISDTRGAVAAVEPASGVLDESVIPPTDDARVAGFAAEAEPDLGDLLTIPFGPQALASFAPQGTTADSGAPLWPQPAPSFAVPPIGVPGGSGGLDGPGDVPGNGPSTPPAPFVPGDTSTTGSATSSGPSGGATTGATGGSTSGSSGGTTGGTTSGTPGTTTTTGASTTGTSSGTPTTGTTGDTTTSGPGGTTTGTSGDTTGTSSTTTTTTTTTGSPTTGDTTSGIVTTGSPTSGVSGSTNTGHEPPHEAPEPNLLWLVACGALGLASRRWRASGN